MQRAAVALVGLLGCGRISFDPLGDGGDDGSTSGMTISLELPAGGQMSHVAIGPDGTWYASSDTSGVYRSDDHITWTRCGARIGTGLAVSGDGSVWLGGADIGRSTDRCATWQATGSPRFSDGVEFLNLQVFGLLDNGLLHWNGASWVGVPTPADGTRFRGMALTATTYIIGTEGAGILHSTDGTTWTKVTAGLPNLALRAVAAGPSRAYAISAGAPGGIACGSADGVTWSACSTLGGFSITVDPANDQRVLAGVYDSLVLTSNAFANVSGDVRASSGLDDGLVLDLLAASDGSILAATDRGIFYSPSFALAFEPRLTGLDSWDTDAMLRDGEHVYLATRGGVLHAQNGAPFTISTAGISSNTNIRALAVDAGGAVLATGRNIFRSDDHGASWQSVKDLDVSDAYVAPSIVIAPTGRAYVGTGTRLLIADPPYTTWTPHVVVPGGAYVNALALVGGELWAGTAAGVYRSLDDGGTFTQVGPTQTVRAITVLADGRLAVGTITNLYLSDAARGSFQISLAQRNITSLSEIGTTLVVTTDNGVAYSADRGGIWTPLPGAETLPASAVLYDGDLVIGSNSGLVRVPLP